MLVSFFLCLKTSQHALICAVSQKTFTSFIDAYVRALGDDDIAYLSQKVLTTFIALIDLDQS